MPLPLPLPPSSPPPPRAETTNGAQAAHSSGDRPPSLSASRSAASGCGVVAAPSSSSACAHRGAVASTCACCWRWLSEGALNVVFAHRSAEAAAAAGSGDDQCGSGCARASSGSLGESSLRLLEGRVVKLNKRLLQHAQQGVTPDTLAQRLRFAQWFISLVLKPLFLGARDGHLAECFDAGRLVWVRSGVLSTLLARDRLLRPPARVAAFGAFSSSDAGCLLPGLLFEDYTSPLHLLPRIPAALASVPRAFPIAPPTVCFEVKPKWGYLPRRTIAGIAAAHQVKFATCRFCMHQHLKLHKGEVSSLSGFCPLDLYSGSPARVRRALSHLLRTPQNNFRIFVRTGGCVDGDPRDGGTAVQMVDLNDAAQMDRLVALLFPQLLPTQAFTSLRGAVLEEFLVSFLCSVAFRPLLARLAHLQAMLDHEDIEGLYPRVAHLLQLCPGALTEERLWKSVESAGDTGPPEWIAPLFAELDASSPSLSPSPADEPSAPHSSTSSSPRVFHFPCAAADESRVFDQAPLCAHYTPHGAQPTPLSAAATSPSPSPVPSFSSPSSSVAPSCSSALSCAHWHDSVGGCCCSLVRDVRNFLLAATLKDVSIMCTAQPAPVAPPTTPPTPLAASSSSSSGTCVHYSVRLVDLECKAVAKLPEYFRLDREIVTHYLAVLHAAR